MAYVTAKTAKLEAESLRIFYRSRAISMTMSKGSIVRPLRSREARIWVDGRASFRRILRWIAKAQHSIIIRMFIWKDDATGAMIRDALIEAAERGVRVHIVKEASGDVFESDHPFLETKQKKSEAWKRFWSHPHITIRYGAARDHTKLYIIDSHGALLTGMNIADEYRNMWHDYLVELRGERFVQELLDGKETSKSRDPVRLVLNHHDRKEVRTTMERAIADARRSIVVEHCYFTDMRIATLLAKRTKQGVRCTIIIPSAQDISRHATMLALDTLRRLGEKKNIRILRYPSMFHAKIVLIDGTTCIVGSANLNELSLDRTGEACVLLQGKIPALRRIRRALRIDIVRSTPIDGPEARLFSGFFAAIGL